MNTAEKISKLRSDNGLDRQEFADRIGIPVSRLEAIENGEEAPDEKVIASICLQFRMSKYDFDNLGEIGGPVSGRTYTVSYAAPPVSEIKSKRPFFISNGLGMYILPRIVFSVFACFITLPFIFMRMADGNFSLSEFLLTGNAAYHFSFLISLPFVNYFYTRAFSYIAKKNEAKRTALVFLAFESAAVGLITSALTCVRSIMTDILSVKMKYVNLPVLLLTALLCSTAVITSLFFFERMTRQDKDEDVNRKFLTGYTVIMLVGVISAVLDFFVLGVHSPYPAAMTAVRILAVAYAFYLNADREKLSNIIFVKVLPFAILFALLLTSYASGKFV